MCIRDRYTHGAVWFLCAFCQMGEADQAVRLFDMISPIQHAQTLQGAECYRAEPYVVSADIYSVPPNAGRAGWSWYTGSAGWMIRLVLQLSLIHICNLFSIGYDALKEARSSAYYDLYASEARLMSLCAVAKGDVPEEHMKKLARPLTSYGLKNAMLSWSGTMFEYLMPMLFYQPFLGTVEYRMGPVSYTHLQ